MEDHDPPAVTAGGWALPCARGGALAARACALLPERVATPLTLAALAASVVAVALWALVAALGAACR
jgi:hypothetical protein